MNPLFKLSIYFFILGSSPSETNEYSGFSSAESAGNRSHRHQYSDMLNQVYTSHLHAQLNHPGSNQVQSHNSSKGSSQMFGNNNQSGQTAFGKSNFLYTSRQKFRNILFYHFLTPQKVPMVKFIYSEKATKF